MRTRRLMETHFPEALVDGYEHRIESLSLPDANDRHVLAAAIHAGAKIIVTTNLRDFPLSALRPLGLRAVPPDAFLLDLLETDREAVIAALRRLRLAFESPTVGADQLLEAMQARGLPSTSQSLRAFLDRL